MAPVVLTDTSHMHPFIILPSASSYASLIHGGKNIQTHDSGLEFGSLPWGFSGKTPSVNCNLLWLMSHFIVYKNDATWGELCVWHIRFSDKCPTPVQGSGYTFSLQDWNMHTHGTEFIRCWTQTLLLSSLLNPTPPTTPVPLHTHTHTRTHVVYTVNYTVKTKEKKRGGFNHDC